MLECGKLPNINQYILFVMIDEIKIYRKKKKLISNQSGYEKPRSYIVPCLFCRVVSSLFRQEAAPVDHVCSEAPPI
jgi:hypothetical protein